ncbi:MAG TPA: NfeD family protein [Caulobacteraceae bacterium]|jgi:membrane protein implicated in regulation of membrane protease activity|nr:NfeD family protein [Caulobacteraceae bacterium]
MDLIGFYAAHPFWWWVAAAVAFLAVEVGTGTSYLLWPSASAGVVAVLALAGVRLPAGADLAVFAVLTIASTLTARRYIKRPEQTGPDINDPHHRLAGRHGEAVAAFVHGQGRVFVDGKEWAAELDGTTELAKGDRVEVAAVLDGGRLKVRPV